MGYIGERWQSDSKTIMDGNKKLHGVENGNNFYGWW